MKTTLVFSALLLCSACGNTQKYSSTTNASYKMPFADTLIKDSMHQQQMEYILRNKIQGVWADVRQTNVPAFEIKIDSVYYHPGEAYRYELRRDSIFIIYPDWTYSGKVTIAKDTMIISSETGESRYIRSRPF